MAKKSAPEPRIKRALISVSDKTGIVELARFLQEQEVEIISTGGTKQVLKDAGIKVVPVSSFTGEPEILEGRVKTLHPKIAAGILFRRSSEADKTEMNSHDYKPIDLVVVDLYPFEKTVAKGAAEEEIIENIDIGGPTLIRAAAKNFADVTVLVDPTQYDRFMRDFQETAGAQSLAFRRQVAAEAFRRTNEYDGAISSYFEKSEQKRFEGEFPEKMNISLTKEAELRYGENPHQKAALYRQIGYNSLSLADAKQLAGKELSFNNYTDLDATLGMIVDFERPFACILKHANPCGAAEGLTLAEAYRDALASDPMSAFGSIIGLNRNIDLETARLLHETEFVECILAPGYEPESFALLKTKKLRRLMELPQILSTKVSDYEYRPIRGGFLYQTSDRRPVTRPDLQVVTKAVPTGDQFASLLFGFQVVKHLKSNAIAIVQGSKLVGFGCGQTSRVDAVENAVKKAGDRAHGAVLASDAFFPMPDGVEKAAAAGVKAIIQPGGSKRDDDAIKAADAASIAMVFSGIRHFRH